MIDNVPNQMTEPITESNKRSPQILEPLSGSSPIQYGNKSIEEVTATIGSHPRNLIGELPEDIRHKDTYPSDPEKMLNLLMPEKEAGVPQEDIRSHEFDMQMKKAMGLQSEGLPPYPLTPEELSGIFRDAVPVDKDEYTIWVPVEREVIDKTTVGTYRQSVEGDIISFTVEHDGLFTTFLLIADYSETGFSWYQARTTEGSIHDGLLKATDSQRLERLLRSDDEHFLSSLPDRVRNASGLFNKRLTPDNKTATPDGWLTTMCKHDVEKSEAFNPRYEATFIHKESEIVIELLPLQSEKAVEDIEGETTEDGYTVDFETTNPETAPPGYEWDVSFAGDEIEAALTELYGSEIHAKQAYKMMLDISDLLSE